MAYIHPRVGEVVTVTVSELGACGGGNLWCRNVVLGIDVYLKDIRRHASRVLFTALNEINEK
jgi:hypothetical protein